MSNELVGPVVNNYPDVCVTPFSGREAMLCEALFWIRPAGMKAPQGIHNLDVFLAELGMEAHRSWLRMHKMRDEIVMLKGKVREYENLLNEEWRQSWEEHE